jgi:integrase
MAWRVARMARTKSGSFKARKAIPADIRDEYAQLYGKRREELFRAPPDVSPSRAKALRAAWEEEIETRYATLRAQKRGDGHDLTQRQAAALAGDWYRWFTGQHEDNPGNPSDWDKLCSVLWDRVIDVAGDPTTGTIDLEAAEVQSEIYPPLADEAKTAQFLASKGEALTPAARARFLGAVLQQWCQATKLLSRYAADDYSPDQHVLTLPAYARQAPKTALATKGAMGYTAFQLFEAYTKAAQSAAGTISTRRVVFTTLDKYLAGRDFGALSDDEAQSWIASLVTNARSAGTVKRTWINSLKAVGRWAIKQRLIAHNPFADSSVTVPRKTHHRETKAFTAEEIHLILSAACAIKNTRRPTMAARRWIPWICAYTGARGGEIAQLRAQDVIKRGGINALLLTPDAGPMKTRQPRTVPIHEHLIAQGFLEYVRHKGRGPLFYTSTPNDDANTNGSDITRPKPSPGLPVRGHLGEWIRSIGITDREVGPNHGWRHAFKQIAARVGISDRVSDAITGHTPTTEGGKYGAPTLEDMAEALKRFPRYKIGDQSRATPAAPNGPRVSEGAEAER